MYFNLDTINTYEPNPDKALPFQWGILYTCAIIITTQLIEKWYLKIILLLGLDALNIFYLTPKDESSYTIMIFIFILILIFANLFKTKDEVLQRYLEKLQKKLDVEKNYKQLIDDLQEGIIIIDKKFSILYNNMTANTIFGIEPSSSLEEKLVMLEVQDLLIIECN